MPHPFKITRSLITDNTLANGVAIALMSSTANLYLDQNFLPSLDSASENPEFFFINSWNIPYGFNASSEKITGDLQMKSFTTNLWVMAIHGDKVKVSSKKAFDYESLTYEREGLETLLLKKNQFYFRILDNEVWADTTDQKLAERFIVKKISERVSPKIFGVNLGGWLVPEKWMSPKLFTGVNSTSEYDFCMDLGLELCEKRLKEHFETFIQLNDDLKAIKIKGIYL